MERVSDTKFIGIMRSCKLSQAITILNMCKWNFARNQLIVALLRFSKQHLADLQHDVDHTKVCYNRTSPFDKRGPTTNPMGELQTSVSD